MFEHIFQVFYVLVFDKTLGLLIALSFGLAGVPFSWWLFREEKGVKFVDKAVFGFIFSLILIPLLFVLESIVGIYFSLFLVFVNWIAVFALGSFLLVKDKAIKMPSAEYFIPSQGWAPSASVLFVMFIVFMIGMSVAGTVIFELDPYYYIEGVKQIVYQGRNFENDGTAWFPYPTSHLGTPIWKYPIASWFALYNGNAPYDPYTMAGIGSIQPPIIGALVVFATYFLFREMFNSRVGFLAAACLAFMPAMLIKFQGGDFQVEPFNVFALMFFFASTLYAFKRPEKFESIALFFLSYLTIIFASNLGGLMVFAFSIFLFLVSLSAMASGSAKSQTVRVFCLKIVGAIALVQLLSTIYWFAMTGSVSGALAGLGSNLFVPLLAFAVPWSIDLLFDLVTQSTKEKTAIPRFVRVATLFIILGILGVIVIFFSAVIPVVGNLVFSYVTFGAYTEALHRTIAEQSAGSPVYSPQFGFVASALGVMDSAKYAACQDFNCQMMLLSVPNDFTNPSGNPIVGIFNLLFAALMRINAIATIVTNMLYGIFVWFMNDVMHADFEIVSKSNSLMTFFLFFSVALIAMRWLYSIWKQQDWPIHMLLMAPFIVPVSLVAFGKQKLVMYLGVALIFAIGVFWGEMEFFGAKLLALIHRKLKLKKDDQLNIAFDKRIYIALSILGILFLSLMQFGSPAMFDLADKDNKPGMVYDTFAPAYGLRALPLFASSFTPRVQDSPAAVLPKLQAYCKGTPQDVQLCSMVANWNATTQDPDKYFSYYLCARSLWLYPDKQPHPDFQLISGYRCSFVSDYWLDSMQWMRANVNDSDRVISWWDYGHWTNFFAEKKTVLRNEHAHLDMIGRTAYSYLDGTPKDLRDTMRAYGSRTALFDVEILGGGTKDSIAFGGKYGALNYLGCDYANLTSVAHKPGQSQCESDHIWEQVYVPVVPSTQKRCVISENSGLVGFEGYTFKTVNPTQPPVQVAAYCFTEGTIGGARRLISFDLSRKDSNGDLAMQRANWIIVNNDGRVATLQAVYNKDKIWPDANGTLQDGWADRTTEFYNSNLYSAFMLNELEGFDLVYNSPQIRIYRMQDAYFNSDR